MNYKSIMILIVLLVYKSSSAQEWKSLKAYQKNTGNRELLAGCWLKKDRNKLFDLSNYNYHEGYPILDLIDFKYYSEVGFSY